MPTACVPLAAFVLARFFSPHRRCRCVACTNIEWWQWYCCCFLAVVDAACGRYPCCSIIFACMYADTLIISVSCWYMNCEPYVHAIVVVLRCGASKYIHTRVSIFECSNNCVKCMTVSRSFFSGSRYTGIEKQLESTCDFQRVSVNSAHFVYTLGVYVNAYTSSNEHDI